MADAHEVLAENDAVRTFCVALETQGDRPVFAVRCELERGEEVCVRLLDRPATAAFLYHQGVAPSVVQFLAAGMAVLAARAPGAHKGRRDIVRDAVAALEAGERNKVRLVIEAVYIAYDSMILSRSTSRLR